MKDYIVSVLDYFFSSIDVFRISIPTEENDVDVYIQDAIEERGHHCSDCNYMCSTPSDVKITIDLC